MPTLLVVVERSRGAIDDSAWELCGAARSLAGSLGDGTRVAAALIGHQVDSLAKDLARRFDDVHLFDSAALALPDGGVAGALLAPLIERLQPAVTLIPHTNNGMDLAPALSVRTGAPLLADCLSLEIAEQALRAVRTVYGGKVHARVSAPLGDRGAMATVRPGAIPAAAEPGEVSGTIHQETVPDPIPARRRSLRDLAPEPGAVDISQAERLVAVGRGIEEEENLDLIRKLAEAMGAEMACSRPVVDKKWLPKSRQVGTSGVSVKPKVYLAVGISGSFQHMGGVKGRPFVAAINKDPRAPIFGVADVGIVGDMFEIVPLLEDQIRKAKG